MVAEQTTNFSGGAVWDVENLCGVADRAHERGLKTHLDGARLLNAVIATGVPAIDHARGWDSAWIALTKGLGCPIGAVLCGSRAFIAEAWRWKVRLGGAMRQSGVIAAAGLYALDHHVDRLADDHANARLLASMLSTAADIVFDPPEPRSNIVRFSVSGIDASALCGCCLTMGVRLRALDPSTLRATTHLDVSREQISQAATAILAAVDSLRRGTNLDSGKTR